MSRVGKKPIPIPEGVKVKIEGNVIEARGPQGKLTKEIPPCCQAVLQDNQILIKRLREDKQSRALHGTTRSLIFNLVKGVSEGFEKILEIVGTGYRAKMENGVLSLELGFSHPVKFVPPQEVRIELLNPTTIRVFGCDKQKVGEVAARIRDLKKPEPYKGKGIRYRGETIRRKIGKRALGTGKGA